jgi:hypothetical protein
MDAPAGRVALIEMLSIAPAHDSLLRGRSGNAPSRICRPDEDARLLPKREDLYAVKITERGPF